MFPKLDVSMIVVLVMVVAAFGVLVWFEINSRRNRRADGEALIDSASKQVKNLRDS
jgi:hypothetical protein